MCKLKEDTNVIALSIIAGAVIGLWLGMYVGVRYHAQLHGSLFEKSYCNCARIPSIDDGLDLRSR